MEYMSQECYDRLVAELENLIKVELPKAKTELSEARDKGDLSENFEYHAAKRAHGKLLSEIRFKQKVLMSARVLDTSKLGSETVGLLRKVAFTNLNNNVRMTYTIVNPHEADMKEGKISIKSPIAEALIGKRAGDIAEAHVPAGVVRLRIEEITL
ncbi:MAG: transcription elongation factor GreA [Bacteroidales bacterium]|nr:transcription elongation factor GreA [Bacteroidales bacterium]MCM1148285.1 transcription elongation factor GreA [Bacteroidales bacterium]MCM1206489.1 transcription elongation factor GreA [Bacillota bacterium]MCM1510375.1 transcription elongation factor GreA [Clostridium sp.]